MAGKGRTSVGIGGMQMRWRCYGVKSARLTVRSSRPMIGRRIGAIGLGATGKTPNADPRSGAEHARRERLLRERAVARDGKPIRLLEHARDAELARRRHGVHERDIELAVAHERELHVAARVAQPDFDAGVARAQLADPGRQHPRRERGADEADRDVRATVANKIVSSGGALTRLADLQPSLEEVYTHYFEGERHAA